MVMYAVVLHLTWAVLVWLDPAAVNSTPVHSIFRFIRSETILPFVLVCAAALALIGNLSRNHWALLLLIPQQTILMMAASGSIDAIWTSQYADGEVRNQAFIAADQANSILAAFGHTWALVRLARDE